MTSEARPTAHQDHREIEKYSAYAKVVQEAAQELQAFIVSEASQREFNRAQLQQSRLAAVLVYAAAEEKRADGWTLLSTAGERLAKLVPEEFARLKKQHGQAHFESSSLQSAGSS